VGVEAVGTETAARSGDAGGELAAVLSASEGQLEKGPGRFREVIRATGQEIHLSATAAHPGLDP
jgi:hypothetical protein